MNKDTKKVKQDPRGIQEVLMFGNGQMYLGFKQNDTGGADPLLNEVCNIDPGFTLHNKPYAEYKPDEKQTKELQKMLRVVVGIAVHETDKFRDYILNFDMGRTVGEFYEGIDEIGDGKSMKNACGKTGMLLDEDDEGKAGFLITVFDEDDLSDRQLSTILLAVMSVFNAPIRILNRDMSKIIAFGIIKRSGFFKQLAAESVADMEEC